MENKEIKSKTQVFNVVILDKSGSMVVLRNAAVDGFNETLNGIKMAQEKYADTQDHYVSLVTFCACEMTQVYDKVPVMKARTLDESDYRPCCCTPLYDAMGYTLNSMRKYVQDIEDAVVLVTIITDGLENASKDYTLYMIKSLVDQLKEEGWSFMYMGANQDALEVAAGMSIRNSQNFDYTVDGARQMMKKDCATRMNFFSRLDTYKEEHPEERVDKEIYCFLADRAFDEESGKT